MLWRSKTRVQPCDGFIEPCVPTRSVQPPVGPDWVYEIKHDGYRLMVRKIGDRVKIFTRRGADWTHRFPVVVESARRLKAERAMLDGEGVVCDQNGLADFGRLHSRSHDHEVMLYAFDLLELGGEDLRPRPLIERKTALKKLLARRTQGIVYSAHIEDDGHLVFQHACHMGLEGIVAKRIDAPYRSGRSKAWIKIKNPQSPAMLRLEDGTF